MTRLQLAMVLGILVLVALAPPAMSFIQGGPALGGDTHRYTTGAELLLDGERLEPEMWPYTGYIIVVAASTAMGIGLQGVVVLQLLGAALSVLAVFLLGRSLGGSWAGLSAAALYAIYIDLHRWHVYVLTDSLFVSFSVVTVLAAYKYVETHHRRWLGLLAFFGIGVAGIRPNGWLVLGVVLLWTLYQSCDRTAIRVGGSLAIFILVGAASYPVLVSGVGLSAPAAMMREGYVLWSQDHWRHAMPPAGTSQNGLMALVAYVLANPIAVGLLVVHRVAAALAQVRPYYSLAHNATLVASVALIYSAAIVGAVARWRDPLVKLVLALIVVQLAFVGLTYADYDGRFGTYTIPWFTILGGAGARVIFDYWRARRPAGSCLGTGPVRVTWF